MGITKILLLFLFFTLPLIHGKIFPTLGINLYTNISGNFEFTKVVFFNIFSGVVFCCFLIESLLAKKKISIPSITYLILIILIFSTLFSVSTFTSLIGDLEKGHTGLMFFNVLGLFIVLRNIEKEFLKKLIYIALFTGICTSIIAIKELFFASYNYGALGNRALGSFGHPNYLAGYLLLVLPLTSYVKNKAYRYIVIILLTIGILLSQSLIAIILAGLYILYKTHLAAKISANLLYGVLFLGTLGTFTLLIKYAPEKLHSFLSRFYLWETTIRIIFSDIKIFLIGAGAETLPYYFDSFKVPEVYIYEKYGFTADRPHSFILNIFYHFGILAASLFIYQVYSFMSTFRQHITPEKTTTLLFLMFGIIHFFSIASYVLGVLVIALCTHSTTPIKKKVAPVKQHLIILLCITFSSILGTYYSYKLYHSEILFTQKKYVQASSTFTHPKYLIELGSYREARNIEGIMSQKNLKTQIFLLPEKQSFCKQLTDEYPSAENYIYCGNLFWELGKQSIARNYYLSGLSKLPDLWDQDSFYWDNYFIKNTITGNRFFSEKYGDINGIFEKLNTN